ncbi:MULTISPECIES: N-formylglutamate amidohydrolase [Methylosinus]|uniref:N-formylglutamate amidohydrolase n=1 Tax=Methylosinus trichosporium (strain ATCC 35070 / NCIMB 11131 / UNIQEM 75 / OB3b) TaxID=595536 RepID=A0A2D2CVA5_METT3|nr:MULTISPECIES: N-formylglutamate amidohydrolase [Methylosinus]ATQ66620.1 N-formylglutamate amidohydrolase [Methylosinus trichosporium OB3b]OBS51699.1 N-formylglutamate amidohydrolase [Methylosinus sp. 3S-1]
MSSEPLQDEDSAQAQDGAASPDAGIGAPFEVIEPEELVSPLVFSSPHSGDIYPAGFLASSRLDIASLRRSEDAHVHALFGLAPTAGAPLIKAHFPRAYLDLNREPYELDPRMFEDALPEFVNTRSLRVAAGLGTIPRVVADAREIYAERLRVDEALRRIDSLHKPYHAALRGLVERARRRFGVALLVDCHSMPSNVAKESQTPRGDKRKPDFVLGDRFGASCSAEIVETIEARLRQWGYHVQRNRPYAGGYITEHYGRPAAGSHAVQIEIARNLYMDENDLARNDAFELLVARLGELARLLAQTVGPREQRAAAE